MFDILIMLFCGMRLKNIIRNKNADIKFAKIVSLQDSFFSHILKLLSCIGKCNFPRSPHLN